MLQKWESWGEVCLVESSAEPESLEAVQINLLQDRPQLDVEVHQNGRELLSSTALKRGREIKCHIHNSLIPVVAALHSD